MDNNGKNEKLLGIILSSDTFTTAYIVVSLFLLMPFVLPTGGKIVLWFVPLACVIPFAVMPLFYLIVHRFDTVLFGRYHLVLPVSAFVAALFFILVFSHGDNGAAVFFGVLVFLTAFLLYRYCAFAVRARLVGSGIVAPGGFSRMFSALGAVSALGAFAGFLHYDSGTAFLNTAYVVAGASVVLAFLHYLCTHYGIPRLGGKRVHSVKSVFELFYGGLDGRKYASALLVQASAACIAGLAVLYLMLSGARAINVFVCVVCFGCGYALSSTVNHFALKRNASALALIAFVCEIVSAVMLCVCSAADLGADNLYIVIPVAVGLDGIAAAASVRYAKLCMVGIKPRVTAGTAYILTELTTTAAAGIEFLIGAAVFTLFDASGMNAFAYGCAAVAVIAATAFVLDRLGRRRGAAVAPIATEAEHTAEL